jgi:hypothetical protein
MANADRATYAGSLVVHFVATVLGDPDDTSGDERADKDYHFDSDDALSCWRICGCANRQTHIYFRTDVPVPPELAQPATKDNRDDGDDLADANKGGLPTLVTAGGRQVKYTAILQKRQLPAEARERKYASRPTSCPQPKLILGHG